MAFQSVLCGSLFCTIGNGWDRSCKPLHYALLADNPDVALTLLRHGANPNVKDNTAGHTPLILAASKGYRKVTELLLAHGADVKQPTTEGRLLRGRSAQIMPTLQNCFVGMAATSRLPTAQSRLPRWNQNSAATHRVEG